MNALSAAETSLAPVASIEVGTLTVRVVTGAGNGREPDGGVGARGSGVGAAWGRGAAVGLGVGAAVGAGLGVGVEPPWAWERPCAQPP